jgi:hypothetical protein
LKFLSQLFHSYGYELVAPPLLKFAKSLLVNHDKGLEKETIQKAALAADHFLSLFNLTQALH